MVANAAPAQLPVGADLVEGYEDLERIGQGGFATVYRARESRFDRTVALKILRADTLDDRQLRRFRAECLATGRVSSHPNIVTVYDAGTTPGHRPWLAMEFCSGGSLADKLASEGPFPVAEVISIGSRLSSALHAAHEAGILHRDVKPHNVLLTSYGEPALADFGIASVVIEDDTVTETAAYTVVHAAPEILEGRAGTATADIYSLGSTLYTLLAGQAPFAKEASTGLAPLVTRILSNDVPAIARPGVPPELELLLRRCMAAKPQNRPTSAAELGVVLTEMGRRLADAPDQMAPEAAPDDPALSPRRLLLVLGGALLALLTIFTAWGLTHRGAGSGQSASGTPGAGAPAAAARYAPQDVVLSRGPGKGELIMSWAMPIRPDVVATVIHDGPGTTARAIVTYDNNPKAAPQATLSGLPSGQQACLSAANLVSLDERVTTAISDPVCMAPR